MECAVDEQNSPVKAAAGAPARAVCPHCGRPVILRQRRQGDRSGSLTYFWRHQDGVSLDCPTRPSVISRVGASDGFQKLGEGKT
jgi:hypothetical protein